MGLPASYDYEATGKRSGQKIQSYFLLSHNFFLYSRTSLYFLLTQNRPPSRIFSYPVNARDPSDLLRSEGSACSSWQRPTLAGPIVRLPLAQQRFTSGFGTGGRVGPLCSGHQASTWRGACFASHFRARLSLLRLVSACLMVAWSGFFLLLKLFLSVKTDICQGRVLWLCFLQSVYEPIFQGNIQYHWVH